MHTAAASRPASYFPQRAYHYLYTVPISRYSRVFLLLKPALDCAPVSHAMLRVESVDQAQRTQHMHNASVAGH